MYMLVGEFVYPGTFPSAIDVEADIVFTNTDGKKYKVDRNVNIQSPLPTA